MATFHSGEIHSTNLTVEILEDAVLEGSEHFTLHFTLPEGYENLAAGQVDTAVVTIQDNDRVQIGFVERLITTQEQIGKVAVKLQAVGQYDIPLVVEVVANDKSAVGTMDYIFNNEQLHTFWPGGNKVEILIDIVDDNIMEGTQNLALEIVVPGTSQELGVHLGGNKEVQIDIQDNDGIQVQFIKTEYTVREDNHLARITLEVIGEYEVNFPVLILATNGTATEGKGQDFSDSNSTAIFQPNGSGNFAEINIAIQHDDYIEGDEYFYVALSVPAESYSLGVREGPRNVSTVKIIDQDSLQVFFQSAAYTVEEDSPVVELTLQASSAAAIDYVVLVDTAPVNATGGVDYVDGPYSVVFHAGLTEATLQLGIADDTLYEAGPERLTTVIRLPSQTGDLGVSRREGSHTATVDILDNEDLYIQFSSPVYEVSEGKGEVMVAIETDKMFEYPFSMQVASMDGSATASSDFTGVTSTVQFHPNKTVSSIKVAITEDRLCERREYFSLEISKLSSSAGNGASVGETNVTTVWILDDDNVRVSFSQEVYRISEPEDHVTLQLRTNTMCDHSFQSVVEISTESELLQNFGRQHNVTIAAGQTSSSLALPLSNDEVFQCERQAMAAILAPIYSTEAHVSNDAESTTTIVVGDDDEFSIRFVSEEYHVLENVSSVQVCLEANRDCNAQLTVHISTGGYSSYPATEYLDYSPGPFPVVFAGGSTTACADIPIIDDVIFEGPQAFLVTIDVPEGVRASAENKAKVTILDNDDVFCTLLGGNLTVIESQGVARLYITPSTDIEDYFACDYETSSLTAKDGFDFEPIHGRIVLHPNSNPSSKEDETPYLEVSIVDDYVKEPPELFHVLFYDALHQSAPHSSNVSIVDDDEEVSDIQCSVSDSLEITPFQSVGSYPFTKSCEHTLVSTCAANTTLPTFAVHVDFTGVNLSKSTLVVRWYNSTALLFSDNSVRTENAGSAEDLGDVTVFESGLRVFKTGQNISLEFFELGVEVVKILSPDVSYIVSIASTSVLVGHLCGLCGDISGALVLGERGRVVPLTTATAEELEELFLHYSVSPATQLTPNRRECSDLRNDSVVGDPLFTVPVVIPSVPRDLAEVYGEELSLCYEIRGQPDQHFNLISDVCVSVNAYYQSGVTEPINVIGQVGVVARDSTDEVALLSVALEGCQVSVNGEQVGQSYTRNGISVLKRGNRVRISAPNCDNLDLVMWVVCEERHSQPMIKFVVARGHNLRQTSHGLIGQFWNSPLYIGEYRELEGEEDQSYLVTVSKDTDGQSTFTAELHEWTWSEKGSCLFAGNSEGGKPHESRIADTSHEFGVIEGNYQDYIAEDLFSVDFKYSRFQKNSSIASQDSTTLRF
jgi:hypothetical protein